MPPAIDLTGKRFGRWTVIGRAPVRYGMQAIWFCVCECGSKRELQSQHLRGGRTTSCGCYNRERENRKKHGQSGTAEHRIWIAMKQRCCNPSAADYENYGARGISVCVRWRDSFEDFIADMGRRPSPKHSIERLKNDGGYSPENCCWALAARQHRNTRRTRLLTWNGETKCLRDWARQYKIPERTVARRLDTGRSVAAALGQAVR